MKAVWGSIRWWANFTAALCAWKLFSLYSCLGNKDKLLCGCNTWKKADNKNEQRHAWTHMYKKAETVMHKTHREVITQNVLDPIETDLLCFSNESKALSRQAPSCSISGACLHTWSCTSGYFVFATRSHTCYKKTGRHYRRFILHLLLVFLSKSFYPVHVVVLALAFLSTLNFVCAMFFSSIYNNKLCTSDNLHRWGLFLHLSDSVWSSPLNISPMSSLLLFTLDF